MKKILSVALVLVLCFLIFAGCKADEKVVGIAWRADVDSEFYTNIVAAVEKAGAKPVLLDQVVAEYLTYDEN